MAESKLTKAMVDWLSFYRDSQQNGRPYAVNSMWTRGHGLSKRGLVACRKAGLIESFPDRTLHDTGWRHDITEAGRAALRQQGGSEHGDL